MQQHTYLQSAQFDVNELELLDLHSTIKTYVEENAFLYKKRKDDYSAHNKYSKDFDKTTKIFVNNLTCASNYVLQLYVHNIINSDESQRLLKTALKHSNFAYVLEKHNLKARLSDYRTVKAILKKLRGFYIQQYCMYKKLIGGIFSKYVSDMTKHNYEMTKEETQFFLENNSIYIKCSNVISKKKMIDIAMTTEDKINDTYTDMLLTLELAKEKNLTQFMLTFTASPRFHSNPKFSSRSAWDGSTSQESKDFVNAVQRTIYKRLKSRNIDVMYISAIEAHEDACAHLHAAYFIDENDVDEFLSVVETVRIEFCNSENIKTTIFNKETKQHENSALIQVSKSKTDADDAQSAATYLLKYVMKSYYDNEIAAYYSRDNGGEIRRVNKAGIKSYKSKFNYLNRMKHELLKHKNKDVKALAEMLCSEIQLSEKKKIFHDQYADLIKVVYAERVNRFDEVVKDKIDYLIFTTDFDVCLIKKSSYALNENDDAELIAAFDELIENAENSDESIDIETLEAYVNNKELTLVQCYSSDHFALLNDQKALFFDENDENDEIYDDDLEEINLLDI